MHQSKREKRVVLETDVKDLPLHQIHVQ